MADSKRGVIEILFCDLCGVEKTSQFQVIRAGLISCADCRKERQDTIDKMKGYGKGSMI